MGVQGMAGTGDDRIAQLTAEHRQLEQRLAELDQHLALSPAEQRERLEIKKAKLQLKDELLHLRRSSDVRR